MECTAMQEWMLSSYPILKSMELRKWNVCPCKKKLVKKDDLGMYLS
jgi:hypothetical protein